MSETRQSLFEQFQKFAEQICDIRKNSAQDLSSSGLSADEISRIENPTRENFSEITLAQLSAYLFTLDHEMTFTQSGTGKLSSEPRKLTLGLKPITQKVSAITPR